MTATEKIKFTEGSNKKVSGIKNLIVETNKCINEMVAQATFMDKPPAWYKAK